MRQRSTSRNGAGTRRQLWPSFWPIAAFAALYLLLRHYGHVPHWLAWLYLVVSLITFIAYAIDKWAARRDSRRLSERQLLLLGFFGGWPGAIAGQQVLRHKSTKLPFRRWFWASVGANVALFLLFTWPRP